MIWNHGLLVAARCTSVARVCAPAEEFRDGTMFVTNSISCLRVRVLAQRVGTACRCRAATSLIGTRLPRQETSRPLRQHSR